MAPFTFGGFTFRSCSRAPTQRESSLYESASGKPSLSLNVEREIPIVKCSGGNLLSQRVPFVRSTFDWAVCSEAVAVCGGRRHMGIEWRNSPVSEVTMRRSGRNLVQRSGQEETSWGSHFLNREKEPETLGNRADDLIRHVGSFETDSGLLSSTILAPAHRLYSTNADNRHTAGRQASAPDRQALAPDSRQALAPDSRQALAPDNRNRACGRPWPAKQEIRGPT